MDNATKPSVLERSPHFLKKKKQKQTKKNIQCIQRRRCFLSFYRNRSPLTSKTKRQSRNQRWGQNTSMTRQERVSQIKPVLPKKSVLLNWEPRSGKRSGRKTDTPKEHSDPGLGIPLSQGCCPDIPAFLPSPFTNSSVPSTPPLEAQKHDRRPGSHRTKAAPPGPG